MSIRHRHTKPLPRFAPIVGPATLFAPQPFSSARASIFLAPSVRTCFQGWPPAAAPAAASVECRRPLRPRPPGLRRPPPPANPRPRFPPPRTKSMKARGSFINCNYAGTVTRRQIPSATFIFGLSNYLACTSGFVVSEQLITCLSINRLDCKLSAF